MSDIPRDPRAPPAEDADLGEIEEIEDAALDGGEGEAGDGADEGAATDGEDGADEGQDEEVADEPPPPRRGGGSQTIREQRRRAQEAETRTRELERENAELRGFQSGITARQPADPQAAQRAENEWFQSLELMTPGEQARQVMTRGRQEFAQAFQQLQFQSNDRLDKQAYDAQARTNPIFKRYAPEVERVLASERAAGRNPDREVILDVLYGREMRQRAERAAPGQRRAANGRAAAQQTRPTGARSTLAPGSRRPAPGSIEADEAIVAAAIARGEKVF